MLVAIVPAHNEASGISIVLNTLLKLPVDIILPIINGCCDNTLQVVLAFPRQRIRPIVFPDPLGIDVPRAIGAYHAYKLGAKHMLFVDGDMTGPVEQAMAALISSARHFKLDIALADCYPGGHGQATANKKILGLRQRLNNLLELSHLGLATPAHGPHILSRKVIEQIPLQSLAIPPLALVLGKNHNLKIDIGTRLPHDQLGSANRGPVHNQLVSETLIGDLLEAFCKVRGIPPSRSYQGKTYIGYHHRRRFDLIKKGLGL